MKKEWRRIPGWGDRYEVSNHGEVWSNHSGKILSPGRTTAGYLTINLCLGGRQRSHYVHVLVAQAFLPNPDAKPTVNHKRRPSTNNRLTNLEWATYGENHKHAYRVLGRAPCPKRGAENGRSKPVASGDGRVFECVRHAAKLHGVTPCAIPQAIRRGGRCAGLTWKFL